MRCITRQFTHRYCYTGGQTCLYYRVDASFYNGALIRAPHALCWRAQIARGLSRAQRMRTCSFHLTPFVFRADARDTTSSSQSINYIAFQLEKIIRMLDCRMSGLISTSGGPRRRRGPGGSRERPGCRSRRGRGGGGRSGGGGGGGG